jgi:hypothetical protein
MSSYSSSTPAITVPTITQQLQTQCSLLLEREGAWISSVDFDRATRLNLAGDASPSRLSQALGQLTSAPRILRLARLAASDLIRTAEGKLADASQAEQAGDSKRATRLAAVGERCLKSALGATRDRLAVDDRSLVSTVASGALRSLGFTLKQASGTRTTGLWAIRGHEVVAVVIHDGGATEIDTAGLAGDACQPLTAAIRREMADRGVTLHLARIERHGDARGGTLIQRAARCGGQAEGLVGQNEVGVPVQERPTTTALPPQPRAVGK